MTVQIIEIAGHRVAVLPEADYLQLLAHSEEQEDIAAAVRAEQRAAEGDEYVPAALVERLVAGEPALRVWREYRGLSQQALGEKVGLSKMAISGIESGKRDTSSHNWRLLAEALSVDLDDLVPQL